MTGTMPEVCLVGVTPPKGRIASSTLKGVMATVFHPMLATNVGFFITFGLFVVGWLILAFLTIRWAIRHDRAGFKEWRQRQAAASAIPTVTRFPDPGEQDVGPPFGQ